MAEITNYEPGTTDPAAAKKFYQGLFGWQVKDVPVGDGGTYSILLTDEKDVCALYSKCEEERKLGIPPHWLAYISVTNADDTAKKTQNAGGKILSPAFDVLDVGRMAVLQDPTGAVFAVWQAKKHIGARVNELPGTVCWRELSTSNMDLAGKFYATVFGWTLDAETFGSGSYSLLKMGEGTVGGIITSPQKEIRSHWLTYWVTENLDKSIETAQALAARVIKPLTIVPEMCRFAVLSDPQGAQFAILQPV
jgi:hypothetical protein